MFYKVNQNRLLGDYFFENDEVTYAFNGMQPTLCLFLVSGPFENYFNNLNITYKGVAMTNVITMYNLVQYFRRILQPVICVKRLHNNYPYF